jgi:hypothetical protein
MAAARNKYPYITQKTSSSSSAKSSPATRDDNSVTRSNTFTTKFRSNGNYTNSRNNRDQRRSSNFRDDRNRDRDRNTPNDRDNRGSNYNRNNRGGNRDGNRDIKRKGGKRVRFDKAYNIDNTNTSGDKAGNETQDNGNDSPPNSPTSNSDTAYIITTMARNALNTCLHYHESFPSRNKLFQHIAKSPDCKISSTYNAKQDIAHNVKSNPVPATTGIYKIIKETTP